MPIINGDALTELKKFQQDGIDLIVTDPPYGYSFMNKDWDRVVVSVDIWKECLRVLKPGAFAFVMCAPRQDVLSRQIVNLQNAGFLTGFTSIYWTYASGFPKAADVSKLVDKRNGRKSDDFRSLGEYIKQKRIESGLTTKSISELFPSKTGGLTGCLWNWENGENVPTLTQWQILKEKLGLDDRFDELIERVEAEREIIGGYIQPNGRPRVHTNPGANSLFFPNYAKTGGYDNMITKPATDSAKQLAGSYAGFQPKPAVEIVLVVMKPLSEKSYVDQALANGHGVTWLDSCRIPYVDLESEPSYRPNYINVKHTSPTFRGFSGDEKTVQLSGNPHNNQSGRFPANLLVSDDVLNDGTITKSDGHHPRFSQNKTVNCYGKFKPAEQPEWKYTDSGSYSRYFDLDKWFETTFPFAIIPKPSKREKNMGLDKWMPTKVNDGRKTEIDNPFQRGESLRQNIHPTVKPMKLMSYLIMLGSREGDTILDPFCGSGTTLIAAKMLKRVSVGIEINEDYIKIAEARLLTRDLTVNSTKL